MKKQEFSKKIKNEKGVTGADIVMAVTLILITITVVSMIYLNTTVESRQVTRTAGATRIATNILENIEKLSYDEFVTNFDSEITNYNAHKQTSPEYLNYYLFEGKDVDKIFSTKIPNGYNLYIKAEPNYGTHTDTKQQFDLVREIDIIVTFAVGDRTEKIDFQTVKTRDIIGETNAPATEYLTSSGILTNGLYFYPVKYLDHSDVYVKVNESDKSWYNFSNKHWATVIVSKQAESEIFDINGKFIGSINTEKTEETYTEKFVWIPRFFTKEVEEDTEVFYAFAYSGGEGANKIINMVLNSNNGSTSTLNINSYAEITETEKEEGVSVDTTNFAGKTGKWVSCEIVDEVNKKTGITADKDANLLNESKYGPYID